MSFKAEVIADPTGKWIGNALRFATREEAEEYAYDLAWRWTAVAEKRVVECDDPVKHRFTRGVVKALAITLMLILSPGHEASAQYRDLTIYGSDGRVQSRTATDSQGSTTVYGADGKVQARTSTGSNGTTTVYGQDGRVQGTVAPSGMGQRR